jgi:hypothetical protein
LNNVRSRKYTLYLLCCLSKQRYRPFWKMPRIVIFVQWPITKWRVHFSSIHLYKGAQFYMEKPTVYIPLSIASFYHYPLSRMALKSLELLCVHTSVSRTFFRASFLNSKQVPRRPHPIRYSLDRRMPTKGP